MQQYEISGLIDKGICFTFIKEKIEENQDVGMNKSQEGDDHGDNEETTNVDIK